MTADIWAWAASGATTSVVAPGLLLSTRRWVDWDRLAVRAGLALPGFVVLHALITLALAQRPSAPLWLALHVPLLLGAVVYWLPVFGTVRRLDDAMRMLYLFLSAPPLDLAGVLVVILGDQDGGVAMIVGMLPAGLAAVLVTWQWINNENAIDALPRSSA
ncbi:MAG TPA: hypothetical protein VHF06_26480 [Pseudonocardiaceae bacterium]|jgi:hypothetical protein|nr:hypothetical protein [Pseudonocardiaceae bacterium]